MVAHRLAVILSLLVLSTAGCGGGGSASDGGTANGGALPAPANLAASFQDGNVHLTWTDTSSGAAGAELERSVDGVTWNRIATLAPGITTHDDPLLLASTAYHYRLRATYPAGNSGFAPVLVYLRPNVVFVTSTTHIPGALGGRDAADAACQALAAGAGLGGTYVAWLSIDSPGVSSAIDRLSGARGWIRPDRRPFLDDPGDLDRGHVLYPPRLDERGNDLGRVPVVTATLGNGELASGQFGTTCGGFSVLDGSVVAGVSSGGAVQFTAAGTLDIPGRCSDTFHLYCFGVDNAAAVSVTPVAGRLAFVTEGKFAPGGGLAAADALCAAEARAAGVAGTFLAALPTTTASVASRFDPTGPRWVRADGVPLTETAAALLGGDYLDVSLDITVKGWHVTQYVWTGGTAWTRLATADDNCNDWTFTGTQSGFSVSPGETALATAGSGRHNCGTWSLPIRCLER